MGRRTCALLPVAQAVSKGERPMVRQVLFNAIAGVFAAIAAVTAGSAAAHTNSALAGDTALFITVTIAPSCSQASVLCGVTPSRATHHR